MLDRLNDFFRIAASSLFDRLTATTAGACNTTGTASFAAVTAFCFCFDCRSAGLATAIHATAAAHAGTICTSASARITAITTCFAAGTAAISRLAGGCLVGKQTQG